MVTCASKNTAYWQLLSGRSILCSLEPLACEWNFPAVHKNTGTTSRVHLRSLEKLEVGDISQQCLLAIWSEWLSLNACCLDIIRIHCREDCVTFSSNKVATQPTQIIVFTHVLLCTRFRHVNMDMTQKMWWHIDSHSSHTTWFGKGSLQVPGHQA